MCGYMKKGGASRFYSFKDSSKRYNYSEMMTADGKIDNAHSGGMAIWNNFVYLATGENINVYSFSELKDALAENEPVSPISTFEVPLGPAFCYAHNNYLYVGEFYRAENYETDKTHHMTTDSGDEHKAIIAVYKLSEKSDNGISSRIPVAIYSVTDQVQGFCITDSGKICLTTSWSLEGSHLLVYDDPAKGVYKAISDETIESDGDFEIESRGMLYKIPLYYLDSDHLERNLEMIPMAESPVYKDGKVNIIFESASNKYMFGKLSGGTYIYSVPQD